MQDTETLNDDLEVNVLIRRLVPNPLWLFASTTLLFSPSIMAEAATDEANQVQLPKQVVSATGYRQQTLMAPSAIVVIDKEQIRRAPVADLGEVFRDIPGIALVDSGVPGMKRLSIRGESARRVLIKINGQPLADHSNYGTPLLLDVSMVERIEIVRGSASVVHGSNAIGGVINITTRQMHSGEQEVFISGGYYSATQGYRAAVGTLGALEKLDYRFQVSHTEQDNRQIPHGELKNSDSNSKSVSAELGYRFGQSRVAWQGDYYITEANAWTDPAKGVDFMGFPERSSLRNALSYNYENKDALLHKVNAQIYHHSGTRILETAVTSIVPMPPMTVEVNNRSDDDLSTEGLQLTFESNLLGNNITVFGINYQQDTLEVNKHNNVITTIGQNVTPKNTNSFQNAEQSFWSTFVQQQVKLLDNLEAHIGIRYYDISSKLKNSTIRTNTSQTEDKLVSSTGLVWKTNNISSVRLNIAQGYTYPSVTQLFAETTGGKDMHFGNPELKSEKSTTFELGGRIEGKQLTLDTTLYLSNATDFIDRKTLTAAPQGYQNVDIAKKRLWQWVNVSEADSYGAEIMAAYQIQDWRPYTNISVQQRKVTFANGYSTHDSGLPNYMLRAGVQWDALTNLNIDVFARSYGDATRQGEDAVITDSSHRYVAWNVSAQYRPTQDLTFAVALNNLTNKAYQNPEELPAEERAIDIEAHWRF